MELLWLNQLVRTARILVLVSVCLFCAEITSAQTWQRFSPADRSFVVELPVKPVRLTKKDDSPDVIFDHVKASYAYSVNLGFEKDPQLVFGVVQLLKRLTNREFDKTVNDNMLWIGGDDKHFAKQADIELAGLHGREFVYDKFSVNGRTLFLNGGRRIYLVMFHSEVEGATSSEVVSRIFSSFRPLSESR